MALPTEIAILIGAALATIGWLYTARRGNRDRMAIYEHLVWLHDRWTTDKKRYISKLAESLLGRPFYGSKTNSK